MFFVDLSYFTDFVEYYNYYYCKIRFSIENIILTFASTSRRFDLSSNPSTIAWVTGKFSGIVRQRRIINGLGPDRKRCPNSASLRTLRHISPFDPSGILASEMNLMACLIFFHLRKNNQALNKYRQLLHNSQCQYWQISQTDDTDNCHKTQSWLMAETK